MTTEAAAKKDTQRLQRAIVDGLEDVKGQDIVVFNTEHLSPLFERVIVASGTSNRQTKALASSVSDAVREAGFPKPRTEGQDNGEWIIVDCGAAVAHIMQPAIRQYYNLEEIWGEKPIRLRLGAPQPAKPAAKEPAAKKSTEPGSLRRSTAVKTIQRAETAAKKAAKVAAKKSAPAKKSGTPRPGGTASGARKSAAAPAKKSAAPAKKPAAKKAPAKKSS
ncbi:ribosome silencing factor [Ramlibacter sp.]|uniref:ribosome silencing factor n=1 Tax=Ramlibacter sp. TaxID=1917967 RepID=UPI003D0E2AC2